MKKLNKQTIGVALIAIMGFTLSMCKKESVNVDDNPTGKQCNIKSYRLEFFDNVIDPWFEAYKRDASGKIIESTRYELPDSFFNSSNTITYHSNGKINKAISSTFIDSFVYSGNDISKVFQIYRSNHVINVEYNFEYTGGKLKKVIWRDGKTRVNKGGYLLEWTNDNVTKVTTTSDSIGTVFGYINYSDYDNNINPMKDYVTGLYGNIRTDVDVFTYLSKNNYGKITYSSSAVSWDIRKIVANSDKYPIVIKHYRYIRSQLSDDSTYFHYLYNCK